MASSDLEKFLQNDSRKQFTSRSFVDFRQELLRYANEFYGDKIKDFSEVSLGGMLLDFAAIVGDSLVYYTEQQFNELDYETATDFNNVVKHLKRANIKKPQASPSSVKVSFTIEIEVDSTSTNDNLIPRLDLLPVIKKNSVLTSVTGINFVLAEDVDFSSDYIMEIADEDLEGNVETLFLTKKGLAVSGNITSETKTFDSTDKGYFLAYELQKEGVTKIISIVDENFNEYYEVDYLTQETVYKKVKDSNDEYMTIIPAPYRYTKEENYANGKTLVRFGNGEGKIVKDNIFTSPESFLLPIKNSNTTGRVDLNPNALLETGTLGMSPRGRTLTFIYKFGGGISHNVDSDTITLLTNPIVVFPKLATADADVGESLIETLSVTNEEKSVGGSAPMTLDQLKSQIGPAIKMQSRIISQEDLLSRIMTMPTDFGKIDKAVALDSIGSTNSKDLYVVCKDNNNFYVPANDAIKSNISTFLNEYRLVGTNFNILDVPVFNFGINLKLKIKESFNIENVVFDVLSRVVSLSRFDLLQVGQPIDVNEVLNIVNRTDGVAFVMTPKNAVISSKTNSENFFDEDFIENTYQNNAFNPVSLYENGLIYPPRGGIFELRYSEQDIVIVAN